MRVLIIFNHPAPYKVKSFNELSKLVDLTVLFERTKAKDRPDSFYVANDYQFKTIFLKKGYVGNEGSISCEVKKYIKSHHSEYDLIIMNGYSHLAEIKAINYMVKHNIKFGLLINGGLIKKESCLKKNYKKSLISKANYYISPSAFADKYLVYYGAKQDEIYRYSYSNLDESELVKEPLKNKDELRKRFNLPLGKRIFINPSQFIDRKNNMELISLFKDRNDVLLLVGEGKEESKYKEFIAANKMDNVIIRPFVKKEELFDLYKACDCHITLSKEDIFGHTVLEAFANGIPVISSKNVISALEYVKDGYNGFLVDDSNKEEILKKMDSISQEMSKHAIESAMNNTFKNSAHTIHEVLEKIYEK